MLSRLIRNIQNLTFNKGFCYLIINTKQIISKLGELQAAIDSIDQAIMINPNYAEAYKAKGDVLLLILYFLFFYISLGKKMKLISNMNLLTSMDAQIQNENDSLKYNKSTLKQKTINI